MAVLATASRFRAERATFESTLILGQLHHVEVVGLELLLHRWLRVHGFDVDSFASNSCLAMSDLNLLASHAEKTSQKHDRNDNNDSHNNAQANDYDVLIILTTQVT